MTECTDSINQKNIIGYRFPKQCRLTKTDEFSSVFNFRKRISGHFLAIHYRVESPIQNSASVHAEAKPADTVRLGLIVAKKIIRRSVDRNYARRLIREWFRLNRREIPCVDMVIRVQRKFGRADRKLLEDECYGLLDKLKQKINSSKKVV